MKIKNLKEIDRLTLTRIIGILKEEKRIVLAEKLIAISNTEFDPTKYVEVDRARVEEIINKVDYPIGEYEVRGDDGDYAPNERERFLIKDYLEGFLAEFATAIATAKPVREVKR